MFDKIESAIFSIIGKFSDDSGKILIWDVYRLLKQEYNIDRISAGKTMVRLFKEGKIVPSEDDWHVRKI